MQPLTERLEAGEILRFLPCPFPLPGGEERAFLCAQHCDPFQDKYVRYAPAERKVSAAVCRDKTQEKRLGQVLHAFSEQATTWLSALLPQYAAGWSPEQVSWRMEEEAIRPLSRTNRSDLLHIDAFAARPTHGARILRLFVNLHPSDPRVWATADRFSAILDDVGSAVGFPSDGGGWARRWSQSLLRLFRPGTTFDDSEYDRFMLRLHQFLKTSDDYQERAVRRLWHFLPGEAWLAFTDGICHAELRGQFALEHTFLVPFSSLVRPECAPLTLLEQACGKRLLPDAA